MQTLADLTNARTFEDWLEQLLRALQGVFHVAHVGSGTGSVTVTGTPASAAEVVVKVIASGELAVATYQLSLDGGATWSATATIPAGGVPVAVGTTGTSLVFAAGAAGTGTSFVAQDTYSFAVSVPSLPTTAWQPGSTPLTIAEVSADAFEDLGLLITEIAKSGFADYAEGPWLDLVGFFFYEESRKKGVATIGNATLTALPTAGPYNILPGQLWAISTSGKRFTNRTGGTLNAGGTLVLEWQAEAAGAAYNVANNSITQLVTVLAGVSINNPDPGSGSWVTTQGSNDETDEEYAVRQKAKWGTIGVAANEDGFSKWAKEASASVTRAVSRPSVAVEGQVDVYVAGSSGGVSAGVITAVQAYLTPRAPLTVTVNAASAVNSAITVTATVYVLAAYLATAQAAAVAAVEAYFNSVAIGGTVYASAIVEALLSPTGVRNAVLTAPAAEATVLASNAIPTLTNNLTFVAV